MESPASSNFSITSAPSVISDIDDIGAHIEDEHPSRRDSVDSSVTSKVTKTVITPEYDGKPIFEPGDGDIEVQVNGTSFETHRYLIKRFRLLRNILSSQVPEEPLLVQGAENSVEDFQNAFKVLYATILEGPFEFDSPTLVSALRVATIYDYPALRSYAITHLELIPLAAIERIMIAREFELTSWKEPAYVELCERDEPITRQEANLLGMDVFVQVAEIREQEQRRKGKEVDAQADVITSLPGGVSAASMTTEIMVEVPGSINPISHPTANDRKKESGGLIAGGNEGQPLEPKMTPSFIDVQAGIRGCGFGSSDWYQRIIKVSGCKCSPFKDEECAIPSCAVAALKNLQVQQLAHSKSIADLRLSVDKLVAPPAPDSPSTFSPIHSKRSSVREAVHQMTTKFPA